MAARATLKPQIKKSLPAAEKFVEPTDEDISEKIRQELAGAKSFMESEISPERAKAIEYFRGDEFGGGMEQDGRSKVVSMDLRDTINAILPSLMRIFCGSERYVEYCARRPDEEQIALQRTDYVNYIVLEDNPGFLTFYTAFKDALRGNYSLLKWWWDDAIEVRNETYEGMLESAVMKLANEEDVTHFSYEIDGETELQEDDLQATPLLDPNQGAPPPSAGKVSTYRVKLRREVKKGQVRIAATPAEQVFFDAMATSWDDCRICTHEQEVTMSDLIAMGIDKAWILEHSGSSFSWKMSSEYLARHPEQPNNVRGYADDDPTSTLLYAESWIRIDRDGDNVAELTKVCTLGDGYAVIPGHLYDADEIPFALLSPDPEPFKIMGSGFFPLLRDLQLIKSVILRAVLDSLRASIDPRMAVRADAVNMDDLLNSELGGIVRTTANPGEVLMPLLTDFVGRDGLGVLDYFDKIKETRTGQTQGSQGLNADQLQSTSEAGIAAQLSAAQQRIELIARVFAEIALKKMFKGIQRLIMRHQDVGRTVRLRGQWIDGDPASWEGMMDVTCNVGLGNGTPKDRLDFLQAVAQKQEMVLQTIGPSDLVDYARYGKTLQAATEIGGYSNGEKFFGDVPKGWQPPPRPQAPDPATILANAQVQENQTKLQIEREKLVQAKLKLYLDVETARMKIESDMRTQILVASIKAGTEGEQQQFQAAVDTALEHMRTSSDASIRSVEAQIEQQTRVHEANMAAAGQTAAAAAKPTPQGAAS